MQGNSHSPAQDAACQAGLDITWNVERCCKQTCLRYRSMCSLFTPKCPNNFSWVVLILLFSGCLGCWERGCVVWLCFGFVVLIFSMGCREEYTMLWNLWYCLLVFLVEGELLVCLVCRTQNLQNMSCNTSALNWTCGTHSSFCQHREI